MRVGVVVERGESREAGIGGERDDMVYRKSRSGKMLSRGVRRLSNEM